MREGLLIKAPLALSKTFFTRERTEKMIKLKYGNTNTFFIRGDKGGLLVDTDVAGSLPQFFKAIKSAGIGFDEIKYVMATHFHPDHAGLIGELQKRGIKLAVFDIQLPCVHFANDIYEKDGARCYVPVDGSTAVTVPAEKSRAFLKTLGIDGEVVPTPSHSEDSVSLVLDDGNCLVGDLEPFSFAEGYPDPSALKADWNAIMLHRPKKIYFAHANEKEL